MTCSSASDGRFQRPTCADQGPITVTDTHPIGDELFTVTVSSPTDQFSGQDFTGLLFSIDSSTLDVATIDVIGVGGIAAGRL